MKTPVEAEFNDLIHSPARLRICAQLRQVDELEFSVIRDTLGLSDAHLSKNLKTLADADLVQLRKEKSRTASDARMRTWVKLTPQGRRAVEGHLAALAALAAGEL